jgi:hypothetical protein
MIYAGKLIICKKSIFPIMSINFVDKIFYNFGEKWKILDNKMKERKIIHITKVNYSGDKRVLGISIFDGFAKSPSAALRFTFIVAAYLVSTLHSSGFARLAYGAFYFAIPILTFCETIIFGKMIFGRGFLSKPWK